MYPVYNVWPSADAVCVHRLFELVLRPLLRFLTALAVAPLMIW